MTADRRDSPPYKLLATGVCTFEVDRVCLLPVGGRNSSGMAFVREDFRRPSSTNDAGPSTAKFFHGGEMGRDGDVPSFLLFEGGPSLFGVSFPTWLFFGDVPLVRESKMKINHRNILCFIRPA